MNLRHILVSITSMVAVLATEVTALSSPTAVNSTNHVQLSAYDYDSGYFSADIFIYNDDYNKVVLLYYENLDGDSTPLTSISAGYSNSLDDNWELWTINSSIYAEEGLTGILNVTYTDTDAGVVYVDVVNAAVTESGDTTASAEATPTPLIKPSGFYRDIDTWLTNSKNSQAVISVDRVLDNINVEGSVKGLVIAAQSYTAPDYAYHWVRDASLTFDALITLYESLPSRSSKQAKFLENLVFEYANASVYEQDDKAAITGLGEPKFYLNNNTGYLGPWGRPQNDGPATRASALIKFAEAYIAKGGSKSVVQNKLWTQPIQKDLEFVANNWSAESFDLWEEVESVHFYTRFVQRKALLDGASFASKYFKDYSTTKILSTAASALNETIGEFIYPLRNLILTAYGPVEKDKVSYKDISVILAVNHAYADDNVYSYTNDYVIRSAYEIATSFIPVYTSLSSIAYDSSKLPLAPPIGRYPEDVYDGVGTSEGNPWYLASAAFAEYFYRASIEFESKGVIEINNLTAPFWEYYAAGVVGSSSKQKRGNDKGSGVSGKGGKSPSSSHHSVTTYKKGSKEFSELIDALQGWGDAFLRTIKHYIETGGHLREEFNRYTGGPTGAEDLTWSYASVLTAAYARADAKNNKSYAKSIASFVD